MNCDRAPFSTVRARSHQPGAPARGGLIGGGSVANRPVTADADRQKVIPPFLVRFVTEDARPVDRYGAGPLQRQRIRSERTWRPARTPPNPLAIQSDYRTPSPIGARTIRVSGPFRMGGSYAAAFDGPHVDRPEIDPTNGRSGLALRATCRQAVTVAEQARATTVPGSQMSETGRSTTVTWAEASGSAPDERRRLGGPADRPKCVGPRSTGWCPLTFTDDGLPLSTGSTLIIRGRGVSAIEARFYRY